MKKISKIKTGVVLAVVVILCVGIVSIAITSHPQHERTKEKYVARKTGMPISVRSIAAKSYPAMITTLGEVTPRYLSTLKARVPGRISYLSDRLQVGMVVREGEILVGIEKSHFLMQVAEAESRLKASRLNVMKEEREVNNSKKNWERSGIKGKPASPLVLRTPYLEAVRAEMEAAKTGLENARIQLGHTEIRAPYDGVIMKRSVNPDETVFEGEEVATLYSLSAVEVGVHLDADQWAALSKPIETTTARLIDPRQNAFWDAVVVRESRHLDSETRLRALYLEVKDPLNQTPSLLPGTFVRVVLTGREVADLLCIPEAAQTKSGLVWFVDSNNRLKSHRAEPLFYGEGQVYITNPEPKERTLRVAVSPNASYTNGLLVHPMEGGEVN